MFPHLLLLLQRYACVQGVLRREDKNDIVNCDSRFYPFTNVDPFKPWYYQMRVSILGVSLHSAGAGSPFYLW